MRTEQERVTLISNLTRMAAENVEIVEFALDVCERAILSYCGLDDLIEPLETVLLAMAVDFVRIDGDGGEVSALSEGSKSVSFRAAAETDVSGLLKDYTKQLNRYRRLSW